MPNMYCPICNKKHFVVKRIKFEKFNYKEKQLMPKMGRKVKMKLVKIAKNLTLGTCSNENKFDL